MNNERWPWSLDVRGSGFFNEEPGLRGSSSLLWGEGGGDLLFAVRIQRRTEDGGRGETTGRKPPTSFYLSVFIPGLYSTLKNIKDQRGLNEKAALFQ